MLLHSESYRVLLKKEKGYFMSEYENLEKKPIFNKYGSSFDEETDKKSYEQ